ncbi:uncharacterized protein LOC133529350 [Cydia pomonella]|uniref:uncharacterized protein LOC133529350 n=1 Tax=Cydia pomonella TaxID=82600 RepID=UPI002ADD3A4D|nr:uncharacterized protein LOC133529350 [Cydia pomonella]
MNAKAVTLCIFCIFRSCYNVDLDYYIDDNKDRSNNEKDDLIDTRRIGNEPKMSLDDGDIKILTTLSRGEENTDINSTTSSEEPPEVSVYDNYSYYDTASRASQYPLTNIFDEYEYEYADDDNNLDDSATETSDYADTTTSKEEKNNITNTSKTLTQFLAPLGKIRNTDLYHMVPAVTKLKIKKYPGKLNKLYAETDDNDNIWYVPEEYPCWELPILFGRFKTRAKYSDIFVLKGGTLDGISLEPETEIKFTPRRRNDDSGNKWCDQGPCYGDHTLCTFPNDTISRICDTAYKVKKLSVYEQVVVLNTINTMRNRVAMGTAEVYPKLPTAANMQQVMYDMDLARISNRWLRQCLPGPAACSSIKDKLVTQLECKKCLRNCCKGPNDDDCLPRKECFVSALVGCLHAWFLSAGELLEKRDVDCGHITRDTFNTAQILWANTDKMGCAYGIRGNGDIRVVCNFSPGAPFYLRTKFFCGIIPSKDITEHFEEVSNYDITSLDFLAKLGIQMNLTNLSTPQHWRKSLIPEYVFRSLTPWGVSFLRDKLNGKLRDYEGFYENGTIGAVAKLVTRYSFHEDSNARCDTGEPIYESGLAGNQCVETGRVFTALCYSYRDPYPGYRLAAIVAPVALFSLILYDLFSGVLRQTNF